ncbi:MAG: tetratricopeptide repeat protein [Bacteroidales bacterium]|nr:tetratricopeptide repeat protein [Bacteroidales bacterium]
MTIIHPIGDFLSELFPELKGKMDDEKLIEKVLTEYYTIGSITPEVKVDGKMVEVHFTSEDAISQQFDFNKANNLCQQGKFKEAIPILKSLIGKNPTNSEYYRTLGQAYSMVGDDEEGINYLIDALKWNPKNNYALIMIGNIFARNKNDIETARKYYQQVIENNPDDNIAINNLGTNLIQAGKVDEGLQYLTKAYSINADYPNTLYGIALVNQMKGNNDTAFEFALKCIKKCGEGEKGLGRNAQKLILDAAQALVKTDIGKKQFDDYRKQLQKKSGKEIKVETDNTLDTAAKFEFAEKYDRDYHLIKYNPKHPATYHLVMHELVHLDFATDARNDSRNKLFISNFKTKSMFLNDLRQHRQVLIKKGLSESSINEYFDLLFDGINRQIFNAPIDLFIEDKLFEQYKDLRPYQLISLYSLLSDGIKATTEKTIISLSPISILQASKILNLVGAYQFRDLYGIDLTTNFKANNLEDKTAKEMYAEFY